MESEGAVTAERMAERKRQFVRDEMAYAALRRLAFQGYDETTIDQITADAGISRRTFFRYFESKEDVVVDFLIGVGDKIQSALAARPPEEPPAVALRHAIEVIVTNYAQHPEKSLRLATLVLRTPALRARYLERQLVWRDALTRELSGRTVWHRDNPFGASFAATITIAALNAAVHQWVESGRVDGLAELVDRALHLATPSINASTDTAPAAGL